MFLLGDVLSIIGLAVGATLASWAVILLCTLLFPARSERAHQRIAESPVRVGLTGLVVSLLLNAIGWQIFNVPNPIAKILGFSILFVWAAFATIGAAGIVRMAAARLREEDSDVKPWNAMTRATAYLTIACLLPFIGTFGVSAAVLIMGTGAGWLAMRKSVEAPVDVPTR